MMAPAGRTVEDLARLLGGRVAGDGRRVLAAIAPLDSAGPSDLSFLANRKYLPQARVTEAGAVIVAEGVDLPGRTRLVVEDPYLALAEALAIFLPAGRPPAGIDERAVLGAGLVLGDEVSIMAGAVLGAGCRIGSRTVVMP
ncbi:MAG TPA: LpxD N-terminal domain-containing protein, partial [Candidatus Polarisedimenticolia bacterium]|nr:LpxD N-terminal domain-containing protein [Candidatus Polarisedimenticolia bacterium]